MRKLGSVQRDVLRALEEHGMWHSWCGWIWDSVSNTTRIMDSLVRAGVATVDYEGVGTAQKRVYRPKKAT